MPASRRGWRTSARSPFPPRPSRAPSPTRWNSPTTWTSARSSCAPPPAPTERSRARQSFPSRGLPPRCRGSAMAHSPASGTFPMEHPPMEHRYLGASGFRVPVLSFGTGTFGGEGALFSAWGSTDVVQARRMVDLCMDAGLNMFDSADVYSKGAAESILGEAIKGRPRDSLIISTKATFRFGDGENQVGSSRHHLINAVDGALKRLGTDYIDLFQLHGFDARTP